MKTIQACGNYNINIDNQLAALENWFQQKAYSKYVVLVDENTKQHCYPILKETLIRIDWQVIEIKSGEQEKNFETLQQIIEQLINQQADRKTLLINLGGGVICDMGAFAASIYKRGIHFIQIPTTLLAMVDASVGGKTGINFKSFKNQVGTFTHPQLVYINTAFLGSLPARHISNGLAEVIKHNFLMGEISDMAGLENMAQLKGDLVEAIHNSVAYKNKIVTGDFKEKGARKQLNFGHTVGHAIESYSLKNDGAEHLYHGEAIASGFIMEAFLSEAICDLQASEVKTIIETTLKIFKPYTITNEQFEPIISLMMNDKKNQSGKVQFALLKAIGKPVWDITISKAEIINTFKRYEQQILHAV